MIEAALAIMLALAVEPLSPYIWPLDLPQAITSSFGEYRGGRFHAGLDLRTGGIGKKVKAPAAGHVSRVRCSPWGYGKALYLTLDDGNTAVFGHLSEFAPNLRDYVRHAQHKAKNYTVDLEPPAAMFKFNAGDGIAASGDTGIGPAHLHYELRDEAGRPFNPRRAGISWPDTTQPILRKLVIVPDGAGSLINGDVKPVVLDCQAGRPGTYACGQVTARGRIGIGLDLFDPANNGDNKLGVYSVRTLANGLEKFAIRLDAFSYEESRHEIVSYHPFLSELGRFLLQWRWPGNGCNIFANNSDGWIEVAGEPVEIRIEAEDFFGNKAAIDFAVQPEPVPTVPIVPNVPIVPSPSKPGSLDIDCVGAWLIVTARFPDPQPVTPILHAEGAQLPCAFHRVGQKTFRAAVTPAPNTESLAITAEHPRLEPATQLIQVFHRGAPARTLSAGDANVTVKPESPYGVIFLRAETLDAAPGETPAPCRGPALRLWPDQTPIDAPVDLSMPVPADAKQPDRIALYRRRKTKWEMLPTRRENNRLIASISEFGQFALLEDTSPPTISDIAIQSPQPAGAEGRLQRSRPTISARVADSASGIADVTVTCNGQWLLAAYDPEAGRVNWERDEDLPPPPWEFTFTATDNAGNHAQVAWQPGNKHLPQKLSK